MDKNAERKLGDTPENNMLFQAFIEKATLVVADPNGASRTGIARTLTTMGARAANIATASTYQMAESEIERVRPSIIVCDYDMNGESGLNLLQKHRQERPDAKKSIFVLVTGNSSQSAVAQAAEEDVDTFVLKPYTLHTFKQQLFRAIMGKINPSDYAVTIEAGKEQMLNGEFDAAIATFEAAAKLHPKPALAHFYQGQTRLMKQMMAEAKQSFSEGLDVNKMHYKCLTGLFDLLMGRGEAAEAYAVVKRISKYFPANPKRLSQVLRLAIMTKSYEDIEGFYQSFISIEARNDDLIKFVCAALVVCGKFYLSTNTLSRAFELFHKAVVTAAGRTKVLREVIVALCEFNQPKQAQAYLTRFDPKVQSGADYQVSKLSITAKLELPTVLLEKVRGALKTGVEDPILYKIAIEANRACGYHEQADDLATRARARFPNHLALFGSGSKDPGTTPASNAAA